MLRVRLCGIVGQPRPRRAPWQGVLAGASQYGAGFVLEVLLFYCTLVAYQQLGYSSR